MSHLFDILAGRCNTNNKTKGHPIKNLYNADIYKVDGMLFETMEAALTLITRDWREWTGVGSTLECELIEVVRDDEGDIVIRYFNVMDYDENDKAIIKADDMTFQVELDSMMMLVA